MRIFPSLVCWLAEIHRHHKCDPTAEQVRALSVVHWKLYGESTSDQ
jgi:hypothetical protein